MPDQVRFFIFQHARGVFVVQGETEPDAWRFAEHVAKLAGFRLPNQTPVEIPPWWAEAIEIADARVVAEMRGSASDGVN